MKRCLFYGMCREFKKPNCKNCIIPKIKNKKRGQK